MVATHVFTPLVGRTEIWNEQQGLKGILEYPIKSMNTVEPKDMAAHDASYIAKDRGNMMVTTGLKCIYQVDAGPVAYPGLAMDCDFHAERMFLAYIAFNSLDIVDFVAIQPTPIEKDGKVVVGAITISNSCISRPGIRS